MAAKGQPTNPTAPRQPVQGEAAETQEQQSAAPIGPDMRGRTRAPALPVASRPATIPVNSGLVGDVVPPRGQPFPMSRARPSTTEEEVALAMLGMGTLTTVGRRFALALRGIVQPDLMVEVPPRGLYAESLMPEPANISPAPEAAPEAVPVDTTPPEAAVVQQEQVAEGAV